MYSLIEDDLFKKYNTIWDKVSADVRKEFDSKSVFKSRGIEFTDFTDFRDKEFPKVDSNHTFLAVTSLDSTHKEYDKYYPQVFLKECKYIKKKILMHIHNNLNDFFYSSGDSVQE